MSALEPRLDDAQASSGSPFHVGQIVVGKYRIERQIGRGGMGIVLAATHLQLEHLVAIKVMRRDLLEDDKALNRLLFEARSAARIRSEHVARVLDVGTLESGSPFIVMEYLEGEDLADLLDRQGALAVEQAISFMLQSCEALAEVHVAEMIHRDLKPGNLFIARLPDGSPTVKIVDFGISKHIGGPSRVHAETTSPQVLGSPFYMAPEQMRADSVDERSDIWALGAILFEMLTGRPPFIGDTLPEVYSAVLNDTPPAVDSLRPGVPAGLDDVVQRCLEKDPAQRFCDVADLAEALAPFGGPTSVQSLERITRILTNPEPIRSRYSSPPTAEPVGSGTNDVRSRHPSGSRASAPGSLIHGSTPLPFDSESSAAAPRANPGPGGTWAGSTPGVRRVSAAPAEIDPPSATGSGTGGEQLALRPRSRAGWLVLGLGAALVGAFIWIRTAEPGTALAPSLTNASEPSPASTASPSETAGDPRSDVSDQPIAASPGHSQVAPVGQVTHVRRELRPVVKDGPPISVDGFRAAVVAGKRKTSDRLEPSSDEAALPEPGAAGPPAPPRSADNVALPAKPVAAPRAEPASSEDPWDPDSFGDRR